MSTRMHAPKMARLGRLLIGTALITLAAWALFTWPLPREFRSGVPYAAKVPGPQVTAAAVPGDHLQLMYHFWLFSDMLAGRTPWLHNLYEFNTGPADEVGRREFSTYYLPFSALFAIGEWLGGHALGWNLAGLFSLWAGYLLSVLLARRYTTVPGVAWIAALPFLMLPHRWDALLGGSPMGFAMMWVPAILLGLDVAVRDNRASGGILAGIGLIGACMGDLHVLAFGILAAPVICAVAFLARRDFRWSRWRDYAGIALALAPVLVSLAVVAALRHAASSHLAGSTMSAGRDMHEVAKFSPEWRGLFFDDVTPISHQIFIGYALPACLLLGTCVLLARWIRSRGNWRDPLILTACLVVGIAMAILSLGARDPFGGYLIVAARKFIPPYTMIRQPAKIFCLMPGLLAIALALGLGALATLRSSRAWRPAVLSLFTLLLLMELLPRVRPGITLLQREQPAYAAIAKEAEKRAAPPRALVIPFWPGDTHYTSIYQHHASLYRIRMVNGYSPVVSRTYKDVIFPRFASANQGLLDDAQLDDLLARDIQGLLLHEDLFPEKVSPFPVTFTLKNLLNHPRLRLLQRADAVWAFQILPAPQPRLPSGTNWTLFLPARRWQAEEGPHRGRIAGDDRRQRHVELRAATDYAGIRPTGVPPAPRLRFLVRLRGDGRLRPEWVVESGSLPDPAPLDVNSTGWTWIEIPVSPFQVGTGIGLKLTADAPVTIDVDRWMLAAGDWEVAPAPGSTRTLPAPVFFHAGHTRLEDDAVVFPRGEYGGAVWYGPKLPLAPGTYTFTLQATVSAPAGTPAGMLRISMEDEPELAAVPVLAGQPASCRLTLADNLPLLLVFDYNGREDVTLHTVTLSAERGADEAD